MTRPPRAPAPVTCPNCGRVAQGAPHYCPGCGLDYWRVAAGAAATAARPLPVPAMPDTRRSAALVAIGLAGLIAAGIGTAVIVVGGLEPDAPAIANTLPSRGPEEFVIERFFREARSPYARFSYVVEGSLRQLAPEPFEASIAESVFVHGDDWLSRATYAIDGEELKESLAVVDGTVYVQASADAEWLIGETFGDARPGSPFFRIVTVGEVDYVDSEMDEGNTVHHLVVTKWLGGSGTEYRMVGAGRLADRAGRLDIWVTDAGVPMRARSVTSFSLQQGGVLGQFATDLTLTFDDWGDVDPIGPPNAPVTEPAAGRGWASGG